MRISIFLAISFSVGLAACARQDTSRPARAAVQPVVEAWAEELPITGPWLRDRLPANTLTYQRIPNLMGLIGMPKGNLLDTALGSDASIRNFLNIQRGLTENLADDSAVFQDPIYQVLVKHLRSPIELVGIGFPQPSVLIGMTLDISSSADLQALFAELNQQIPTVPPLAGPLDAEGYGQLASPLPVLIRFDAATGRLALYGTLSLPGAAPPTRASLTQLLDPATPPAVHRMEPLEAQIDESGLGFFGWVDTSQALGLATGFGLLPPETAQMLQVTGLNQLQALAYGTGVANGKGRMKIIADIGSNRSARPYPVIDNRVTARASGEPTSLLLLSIPSASEFDRLENLALSYFPPEIAEQWDGMKSEIAGHIGASIEEILSSLGPEIVAFSDRAGDFVGVKVKDSLLLNDVLNRLTASAGIEIEDRSVNGQIIRHLTLPTGVGMPALPGATAPGAAGAEAQANPAIEALAIVGRVQTRLYWIEDGDYLYFSGLPQALMDRDSLGADTDLGVWLAETQRVDLSSSLVAATGTVAKLPRLMYEAYVGIMQGMADMVEVEYDIWSMPSARQLGLPERGTLGLSFNLGEPYLSLELTYESNPAEVLLAGGGVGAVAAAGVLAAIALPAYQDYTIRAQISEGLNLSAAAKFAVAQTWTSSGAAAGNRAEAGMDGDAGNTQGRFIQSIDVDDAAIVIRYGNQANQQIAGQTVVLTPYVTGNNSVVWVCGNGPVPPGGERIGEATDVATTVAAKYLPSACRN